MGNKVITLTRTFASQEELDHFNALFEKGVVAWEQSWTRLEDAVESEVKAKASVLTKIEAEARKFAEEAEHEIKDIWSYVESHIDGKFDDAGTEAEAAINPSTDAPAEQKSDGDNPAAGQ